MSAGPMFYVRRTRVADHEWNGRKAGEVGWVGPMRPRERAEREAAAWAAGPPPGVFTAEVIEATQEVRVLVRNWTRQAKAARAGR